MSFLQLPLKPASSLSILPSLQKYLVSQYGKSVAENYNDPLSRFQQQRDELLNVQERSKGSRDLYLSYGVQLEYINKHFPINSGQKRIKLSFTWADAFQRKRVSQGNIYYEMACVLFNAAVLESQIASSEARVTSESIVTSVKGFQSAAGIFQFIRNVVSPKIVEKISADISSEGLECLENLMVAQAQQCVVEKSVLDKMKRDSIAKLTIACSNMYDEVLSRMQSSALSGMFDKNWQGYVQGKSLFYKAQTYFFMSQFHNSKDEKGLELAHLYKARELIDSALNCRLPSELKQNCKLLLDEIKSSTSKAHYDNDKVYHERVPPVEELPAIEGKTIAKAKAISSLNELSDVQDVFHELFPIPVMDAQQKFKETVNAKLSAAFKHSRERRDALKSKLAEKGLPGSVMADDTCTGFPDELHREIDRIKMSGGINRIRQLRDTLKEMSSECRNSFLKLKQTLIEEDQYDNQLRQQYTNLWIRLTSPQLNGALHADIGKCIMKVDQASRSDQLIDSKIINHEAIFIKMSCSREEINQLMPQPDIQTSNQSSSVKSKLRELLIELDKYFATETEIENDLQTKKDELSESINGELLTCNGNYDAVIRQFLQPFDDQLKELEKIQSTEEHTYSKIENTYVEYANTRNETQAQIARQEATQRLYDSIMKFDEIIANINEGIHFYSSLQDYYKNLKQRVDDFVFSRKTEAGDIIENIRHSSMQPQFQYQVPPPNWNYR